MKNDRFAKTGSGQTRGKSKQTWRFQYLRDDGAVRAVLAVTSTADHRDVRSDVIHLVPGALVLAEAEALHEKALLLLQEPVVSVFGISSQVDETTAALQVQRILDQGEPIIGQALVLKLLEFRDDDGVDGRLVFLHVITAGLQELREHDSTADGACIRDVRLCAAVSAPLVAAGLLDLGEVALVPAVRCRQPER
jgi:hypothetical protein